MKKETVKVVEIVVVETSDRYIYIERDLNGKIVGLNYMQGVEEDGLMYFSRDGYMKSDKELTKYVLKEATDLSLNSIDDAIWKYFKKHIIEEEAVNHTDTQIDFLLDGLHSRFDTESGDITPPQAVKLDEIKEQLALLVAQVIHQNL